MNINEEKELKRILKKLGIELSNNKFDELADAINEVSEQAKKCQITHEELVSALCTFIDGGIKTSEQTCIEIIALKNTLKNLS